MYYNDYIEHHGIKGQKWGVRRYQNEDGTYTKAGMRRYGMNLDINDKSRINVAKIRTGEAKRRLDVAKANNETNYTRIADLQGKVRSAKKNERRMRSITRGEKLAAKGKTISGNNLKRDVALVGSYYASRHLTKFLNRRMSELGNMGKLTPGHMYVANKINLYGTLGIGALAGAYAIKKTYDSNSLRKYNQARLRGDLSLKSVGKGEYADVVKRRKSQ